MYIFTARGLGLRFRGAGERDLDFDSLCFLEYLPTAELSRLLSEELLLLEEERPLVGGDRDLRGERERDLRGERDLSGDRDLDFSFGGDLTGL